MRNGRTKQSAYPFPWNIMRLCINNVAKYHAQNIAFFIHDARSTSAGILLHLSTSPMWPGLIRTQFNWDCLAAGASHHYHHRDIDISKDNKICVVKAQDTIRHNSCYITNPREKPCSHLHTFILRPQTYLK